MSNYIDERDSKYLYKLRQDILPYMPSFCKEFFIGIGMNTTVLTRYNYALDIKLFFDYLTMPGNKFENKTPSFITLQDLNSIDSGDIEMYLDYLDSYQLSDGTISRNKDKSKARKFCAIRALFRYLYQKDKLDSNVTLKVAMPKIRDKDIIRLEDNEVVEVLDLLESESSFVTVSDKMNTYNNNNTKIRDISIVSMLLETGIRVSELVGINISDIDWENKSFLVTRKGEKKSILYFNDEIKDKLLAYSNIRKEQLSNSKSKNIESDAFFLSLQGNRISVRSVELIVKKYTKMVTPLKNISPHKLRSTYGTALYRATKDIYVVAEVLGHKDINTTKKHYSATSEDIKRSASDKVIYTKK